MMTTQISIPKTAEGLRDALFDEIEALQNGTTTIQRAKAVAQLAARIVDSIRVQIQHNKLLLEAAKDGTKVSWGTGAMQSLPSGEPG